MNKSFYFFIFFLSISLGISAMNRSHHMTKDTIVRDVLAMNATCEEQCSFMDDVTDSCTSKCMGKISKRAENHMITKYATICQNKPFDRPFQFNPTLEEEVKDLSLTIKAYDALQDPKIRACFEGRMSDYTQELKVAEFEVTQQLRKQETLHPVRSKVIEIKNKMRNIEKPSGQ